MRLTLLEHLDWLVLRRVRRGGVVRDADGYQDNGHPLGIVVVDVLNMLDEENLLDVAEPDGSGVRRLALTEAGWDRYRHLCRLQRRPIPPPDRTMSPAAHPSSAPRAAAPASWQPDS